MKHDLSGAQVRSQPVPSFRTYNVAVDILSAIDREALVFDLCLVYWIAWLTEHGEIPWRSRRCDL